MTRMTHSTPQPFYSVLFLAVVLFLTAGSVRAQNPVAEENELGGTNAWLIRQVNRVTHGMPEIEGYASLTSVAHGETIRLFVNTAEPAYTIRIFRIGWYGGLGGREVTDPLVPIRRTGFVQPPCPHDPETLMVECDWLDPYELTIPPTWVSGFYLAKLTVEVSGRQNYIIFVVRDDDRPSTYLFLSAVNTYQAYNSWGGASLYDEALGRGTKVSFNRPYAHWFQAKMGTGDFMEWELGMVRFLEGGGGIAYDVSYATNVDAHTTRPERFLGHRALLSVGHDEYWSYEMRSNVEWARDHCVNLGFFSANSVYWQARYEPSPVTGQPNRTLVVYKETGRDPKQLDGDESNDHLITTSWRQERAGCVAGRSDLPCLGPEDALLGVMYFVYPAHENMVITRPDHPIFFGTGSLVLPGLVGYEADRMFANAPPGTERLARSFVREPPRDRDTGEFLSSYFQYHCSGGAEGNCYSDMTLYQWRGEFGPRVFATGTIQWSWGLDDLWTFHIAPEVDPDDDIFPYSYESDDAQQIMHNVLDLLSRPCEIDPSIPIPGPPIVADIGISLVDVVEGGTLEIFECLLPSLCWGAIRPVSANYPSLLFYDRSELEQVPPIDLELPEPQAHTLVGSVYDFQTTATFSGRASLTLGYDPQEVPDARRSELEVLVLAQGQQGPEWQVAGMSHDPERRAVLAQLPALGPVSLAVRNAEVRIDVKPGSDTNCLQIDGHGVIPVAVLGSAGFDVVEIAPDSLDFAGLSPGVKGDGKPQCTVEDVSGDFTSPEGAPDGFPDLLCQFMDDPARWSPGADTATLTGQRTDGSRFEGMDEICIPPN